MNYQFNPSSNFGELTEELTKYKLHINESKTEKIKTPFISGITIARTELQKLLDDYFNRYIQFQEYEIPSSKGEESIIKSFIDLRSLKISTNAANWIIRDIKSIIKKHNIEYDSITGLTFSVFKKYLYKIYRNCDVTNLNKTDEENLSKFILVTLDILFFLYSMDYRVRATYVMSQIIISTNKFITRCGDGIKHTVSKKIYDESVYLIKNIEQESYHSNVELLNLLISLKDLGNDYLLPSDVLHTLLKIDK